MCQQAPGKGCTVRAQAEAAQAYRAFAKQQDAMDYAAACNRAAAGDSEPVQRIIRVITLLTSSLGPDVTLLNPTSEIPAGRLSTSASFSNTFWSMGRSD